MKTLHNTLEDMFQTNQTVRERLDLMTEHLGSLQDIDEVVEAINSDTEGAEEVAINYIFKMAKEVDNVTLGYMDWVAESLLEEGAKFCAVKVAILIIHTYGDYHG